jgi:hypothetical protein
VSTFYTAYSSSLSTALSGVASRASNFVSANSQSLQSDLSSAQPFLSTLSSSLKSFEATATPPPDPFGKRDTVTIQKSSISSVLSKNAESWSSDWNETEETWTAPSWVTTWTPPAWTPPPHPDVVVERDNIEARNIETHPTHIYVDKRETVTIQTASLHSVVDDEANNWSNFEKTWTPPPVPTETWIATWTPPTPPDVIFDKRAVSVISQGLTCYGQAVVTMSASDAQSQIASATSAAQGTRYIANSSGGTVVVATQTSTSTAGAAKNTRGPMLAVGGAAIAFAFAAL